MNYLKSGLLALVLAVAVVGVVEYNRDPVDLDKLAVDAAELVDVPASAKGETGAQGPRGIQGLQGLQGLVGLVGPVGPQGLKGDNAVFDETAFVKKYNLVEVVVPLSKIFNGSTNAAPTFIVDKTSTYDFTLTNFSTSVLKVALFDKNDNQVFGFTSVNQDNVNLVKGDQYTLFVEATGPWKVVVKE